MALKYCMNNSCSTTSSREWKTGWSLRSGAFANLCVNCGYAFEQRIYCEKFHTAESGWRKCVTCGKGLHCGCIASLSLIDLLDCGGVKCVGCAESSDPYSIWNGVKSGRYRSCTLSDNNEGVGNHKDCNGSDQLSKSHNLKPNDALGMLKQDGLIFATEKVVVTPPPSTVNPIISGPYTAGAAWASTLAQASMGSFLMDKRDIFSNNMQNKDPNLNISLGAPSGTTGSPQFAFGTVTDEREQKKMSNASNQGFVSPSLVPSPPKLPFSPAPDTNMSMMPKLRVGRPPSEIKARQSPLPRYWPRITDQELKQICADSNCTIVPLFEKVLSVSDASKIGRLVLPKACAEAYFPLISQPEGVPMKIQDVQGKEWVFQFRFWPNNNSRMYVLEGVTPCMQSLKLQAGDTVIFNRKDPEGKLLMGFRKASNSFLQDQSVTNGYSGPSQSTKGSTDTHMSASSIQLDSGSGDVNLHNSEKCNEAAGEGLLPSSMIMQEKKRGRKIGSKSKRLLIDNQDVQALRLTWEEVQGMLRPPQNANPNIVVIDGFEFEEYEEPPVFGKSSVFAAHSSGVVEQWAQCDSCSKWRKLPPDFLIPPKWTCADNAWDPARCFCSAPDDLSPRALEKFSNQSKDSKKRKAEMANTVIQEQESSALSALANAAVSGDNPDEPETSAMATTTKHPRHRPGCSCIVCIQPPSGKGNHKSTCTCTVCVTVKRRFKTMMMRKKKRHSDKEAGIVPKNYRKRKCNKEDDKAVIENDNSHLDNENDSLQAELAQSPQTDDGEDQNLIDDCGSGLDLNLHAEHEDGSKTRNGEASLTNLHELVKPLRNSLKCLTLEEQTSSGPQTREVSREVERRCAEDNHGGQAFQERVNPTNRCNPH